MCNTHEHDDHRFSALSYTTVTKHRNWKLNSFSCWHFIKSASDLTGIWMFLVTSCTDIETSWKLSWLQVDITVTAACFHTATFYARHSSSRLSLTPVQLLHSLYRLSLQTYAKLCSLFCQKVYQPNCLLLIYTWQMPSPHWIVYMFGRTSSFWLEIHLWR